MQDYIDELLEEAALEHGLDLDEDCGYEVEDMHF